MSEPNTIPIGITFRGQRVDFDTREDITLDDIAAASGYTVEEIMAANGGRLDSILNDEPLLSSDVVFLPGNPRITVNVPEPTPASGTQTPEYQGPPACMIRTEEDLLRWLWYEEWEESGAFNASIARSRLLEPLMDSLQQMQRQLVTAQERTALVVNTSGGSAEASALVQQFLSYGAADGAAMQDFLRGLTYAQLTSLEDEMERVGVSLADLGIVITADQEAQERDYLDYMEMIEAMEGGDPVPPRAQTEFDPSLAFDDYLRRNFQGTINVDEAEALLVELAIQMLFYPGLVPGIDIGTDAGRAAARASIYEALANEGITDPTLEDLIAFIEKTVAERLPPMPEGMTEEDWRQEYAILTGYHGLEELYRIAAEYHSALALDQLRAIAYDPTWNPSADERLFGELEGAIDAMPHEVLGVDISFAHQGMKAYWHTAYDLHLWRLELKASLDRIEAQMLERAEGEQDSLWWLLEIPLSILVEPLDWLFTVRDVLQGDMLALVGLLPFVPSQLSDALRSIGDAKRYLGAMVDSRYGELLAQIDELGELVEAAYPWPPNLYPDPSLNLFSEAHQTTLNYGYGIRLETAMELGFNDPATFERAIRVGRYGVELAYIVDGERVIGRFPVEFMAMYDEGGQLFFATQGRTSINASNRLSFRVGHTANLDGTPMLLINPNQISRMLNARMTHYHPLLSSFSDFDVSYFFENRLGEMRAFTDNSAFVLRANFDWRNVTDATRKQLGATLTSLFNMRVDRNTVFDGSPEVLHQVWTEIFSNQALFANFVDNNGIPLSFLYEQVPG